jgi:hypothetical protein
MDSCQNIEAKASPGRPDHRYMFIRYFSLLRAPSQDPFIIYVKLSPHN